MKLNNSLRNDAPFLRIRQSTAAIVGATGESSQNGGHGLELKPSRSNIQRAEKYEDENRSVGVQLRDDSANTAESERGASTRSGDFQCHRGSQH